MKDIQPILMVDSAAAAVGGFVGASSVTSFVESTSGAAAGARTGLSNLVVGILFVIFAFASPIIGMVSSSAMILRMSEMLAVVAFRRRRVRFVLAAMMLATVVFPVPDGP